MDLKGLLRNSSSYVTDRQTASEMKDEGEAGGGRGKGGREERVQLAEGRFQLKDISTPYHPIPATIYTYDQINIPPFYLSICSALTSN